MTIFDKFSRTYSQNIDDSIAVFGKGHDFFVRSKATILNDLLAQKKADLPTRILDVGCGTGLIHKYMAGSNRDIHGIDVSVDSIAVAKEDNPTINYRTYDGDVLPYESESFDLVYAICVMHHVPPAQWRNFVNEMNRVLKPGGTAVVIEHNPFNPATQWVVKNSELDIGAVLLKPRVLQNFFRSAGMDNTKIDYIQFTPFEGGFFRKLDRWLAGVPIGAQYMATGTRNG